MKIVIVGGGFAGVRAAQALAQRAQNQIVLVSERSYFEYHAALYRSATGRSPLEVAIPLTAILGTSGSVEIVADKITQIDAAAKTVTGASGSHYGYDRLILALGSVTQYFGIRGLAEHAHGVKSADEALALRRHLHEDLIKPRPEHNYVVVGAGPTGVELAAEMTQYIRQVRDRHGIATKYQVSLIEAAPRILPSLPERLARRIHDRLNGLGVKIHTNTLVKGETAERLQLPEGSLETHTVIWTAGVANNPLFVQHNQLFKLDQGKVVVNEHLEATNHIYVVGDAAKTPFSGMATTALYDAEFVAKLIMGKPAAYRPPHPITAIPVGSGWAAVQLGNRQYYGLIGWLMRRLADLWLYLKLLPVPAALRVWLYGTRQAETCSVCAPGRQ